MFERFTDRARRVVVLAQEEARMLSHNYIGTEHILLGLIHEGEGVAAKALEHAGRQPFLLAQETEQDVLGADVVVLERPGFVLCEDDYLARSLGETFEQEINRSLTVERRTEGHVSSRLCRCRRPI